MRRRSGSWEEPPSQPPVAIHAAPTLAPGGIPPQRRHSDGASDRRKGGESGSNALDGLRVQLVSLNFWPDTTGVAPYATAYAEILRRNGAIVTVDSGVPHYPSWRASTADPAELASMKSLRGVTIHRHRHVVPRRHGLVGRGLYESSFLLSVMTTARRKPDLVLAVTPALAGAAAGAWFARKAGVNFAVIVQDLLGQGAKQSGVTGGRQIASTLGRVEASILRQASVVGVIAPGFRKVLIEAGIAEDRLFDLPNHTHIGKTAAPRDEVRSRWRWPLDRPVVLHSGNMGMKQDLVSVVDAARIANRRQDSPFFVLMGDGNQRREVQEAAAGLPNVLVQDPVDNDAYPGALAAADVLLVNERSTVFDMSLPSKLTSYFSADRPVIACVDPTGATALEVGRSGGGVVVPPDRPELLLSAIHDLVDHPDTARSLSARSHAYAQVALQADAAELRFIQMVRAVQRVPRPSAKVC